MLRRFKQRLRETRRIVLWPLKMGYLASKRKVQAFIVKTMAAHDAANPPPAVHVVVPAVSAGPNYDDLLLALFKGGQRPVPPPAPTFQAIAAGDGRLLAAHPLVGFTYLSFDDVRMTPQVALGQYQERQTAAIEHLTRPGDRILHLGAQQGFHTLSFAAIAGSEGRIVAVERDAAQRALVELNVRAHALESVISVPGEVASSPGSLAECLRRQAFKPTLVYLTDDVRLPDAWLADVADLMKQDSQVRVVAGCRPLTVEALAAHRHDQTRSSAVHIRAA
jgi:hypothetical protein